MESSSLVMSRHHGPVARPFAIGPQTLRRALQSSPQPGIAGAVDQLFIALARSASNPADSFRPAACSGSVHR